MSLVFVGGSSASSVDGIGTDTVSVSSIDPATLTLDLRFGIDEAGVSSAFLSLQFDTNLANELDVLSFETLPGRSMGLNLFVPVLTSQESVIGQEGRIYTFNATTIGRGPANATLAFARVVFVTNPGNLQNDGPDIFAGSFNPGVDAMFDNQGHAVDSGVASATLLARGLPLLPPSTHPDFNPVPPMPPPAPPPGPGPGWDPGYYEPPPESDPPGEVRPGGVSASLPEPATGALLGLGLGWLGLAARRRSAR